MEYSFVIFHPFFDQQLTVHKYASYPIVTLETPIEYTDFIYAIGNRNLINLYKCNVNLIKRFLENTYS